MLSLPDLRKRLADADPRWYHASAPGRIRALAAQAVVENCSAAIPGVASLVRFLEAYVSVLRFFAAHKCVCAAPCDRSPLMLLSLSSLSLSSSRRLSGDKCLCPWVPAFRGTGSAHARLPRV